jgi:hypothetical protein
MEGYIAENINSFYYNRLAGFSGQLETHYKKNTIHLFRLDIKKLRAFYRLLSMETTDGKDLKLPRPLKKMYSGVGKIRDLQQQKTNVEAFARTKGIALSYLLTQLKHELKKQSAKKSFLLPKKFFAQQAEKTNSILPEQFTAETLRYFFLQKMEAIRLVTEKGRFEDDELHAIRKNITDILYVSDVYTADIKSTLPLLFWAAGEQKRMEALAKDLGKYNDIHNNLAWLQHTTTGYTGEDKKDILMYYRAQVHEKKALRHKIIPALQSLVGEKSMVNSQ